MSDSKLKLYLNRNDYIRYGKRWLPATSELFKMDICANATETLYIM